MLEIRKFLLYEIPGLLTILYLFLFIISFENTMRWLTDLIEVKGNLQGLAIASPILAIPVGWFEYQIYDSWRNVHYRTISFEFIKDKAPNMKNECRHAILDYMLKDSYKKYPGLIDSIGSFWDHYKARQIASALDAFFIILTLFMITYLKYPFRYWWLIGVWISIFILNIKILWDAERIRNEVENREFLLVLENRENLDDLILKYYYI